MYAALSQEVSINFVPYGFASVGNFLLWQTSLRYILFFLSQTSQTTEDENGELHFECQHGERECAGNIVQVRHIIIVATSPSCAGKFLQDFINTMATVITFIKVFIMCEADKISSIPISVATNINLQHNGSFTIKSPISKTFKSSQACSLYLTKDRPDDQVFSLFKSPVLQSKSNFWQDPMPPKPR